MSTAELGFNSYGESLTAIVAGAAYSTSQGDFGTVTRDDDNNLICSALPDIGTLVAANFLGVIIKEPGSKPYLISSLDHDVKFTWTQGTKKLTLTTDGDRVFKALAAGGIYDIIYIGPPKDVSTGLEYPGTGDQSYEDTSFVAGDSPVVHDINTDLGRNSRIGYIVNDGPGDIEVEISEDGSNYNSKWTTKADERRGLAGNRIDSLRLTHTGTDSAYRIWVK